MRLFDTLSAKPAVATCFFLGWIAERFPALVREAVARGHEVASHGYAHSLVYRMTEKQFFEDAARSRKLLEDISGSPVLGYRAAGFSATSETPWVFESLIRAGYAYDSSAFPSSRGHGGLKGCRRSPHVIRTSAGSMLEFPISVAGPRWLPLCFFGGGYLRLAPYPLVRRAARSVLADGRPVVFYVHPREYDPDHPRLEMSAWRRFKSYVNLSTMAAKTARILEDFEVTSFQRLIAEGASPGEQK
jgi:polysaccharide deacetylase family protein (PEP-CTERM system associated)